MSKQLPDLPPFRVPGSPDHINDHDLFDVWLAAVRDAFYTGSEYDFPPIPDPAVHGNPGHVEAHNRLRACAEYMKATDYAGDDAFPPIPSAAAEGEQGHVVAHNEFRDVFAYIAAHRPKRFNSATGGTVTTVEDYNGTGQTWRVHTFTASGTFTVQVADQPFRVLVVGAGGGGSSGSFEVNGQGGGGGWVENVTTDVPVGAHAVTIGNRGKGATTAESYSGGSGGDTLLGEVVTAKGGGGAAASTRGKSGSSRYPGVQGNHGPSSQGAGGGGDTGPGTIPNGGPGLASNITGDGTTLYVGGGGGGGARQTGHGSGWQGAGNGGTDQANGGNASGYGNGGGGGGGNSGLGGNGSSGVVIVAYQIG
mgnify:CR=1 FL=1